MHIKLVSLLLPNIDLWTHTLNFTNKYIYTVNFSLRINTYILVETISLYIYKQSGEWRSLLTLSSWFSDNSRFYKPQTILLFLLTKKKANDNIIWTVFWVRLLSASFIIPWHGENSRQKLISSRKLTGFTYR